MKLHTPTKTTDTQSVDYITCATCGERFPTEIAAEEIFGEHCPLCSPETHELGE